MRILLFFCLLLTLQLCSAQSIDGYENDNFKIILKGSDEQGIIFKADSTGKVLMNRDINPYLKIGLPYKERYTEDSSPIWMSYDSSIHHIKMIDTFLNHTISKGDVSTGTSIKIFSKYVIAGYGLKIYGGEWNKSLKHGWKIFDKNGQIVYMTDSYPDKGIKLGYAKIDTSGKYLATIRSDHFEEWEGGRLNPLDFFLDIYSFPDMKLILSEEIPKDFTLHLHDKIFWIEFEEADNSRLNRSIGTHYSFYDLEKSKCYSIYLPRPFGFGGVRNESAWSKEGIIVTNISDGTTIEKSFDRDFKVKELIRK
ncbi:hypothetical protein MASR1M65_30180 [Saprospiraceae bacterium]